MTEQEQFFKWIKADEGGYTDDPDDNGGPTNHGITLEDLRRFRNNASLRAQDVKKLSLEESQKILKKFYWDPLNLDNIKSSAVKYVLLDSGLLHGVYRAAVWLQLSLGVSADGQIGPKTLKALELADPKKIIASISDYRVQRAKNHADYWKYGKGWLNRITRVKTRATKLLESPLTS